MLAWVQNKKERIEAFQKSYRDLVIVAAGKQKPETI